YPGLRIRCCATSLAAIAPPRWGEFLRGPVPRSDLGVADHPPAATAPPRGVLRMGRKLVPLGPETLDLVPEPCRHCVFWELGARARPRGSEDAGVQKEAWLSSVVLEWGPAGHVISVDGEVAGTSRWPRGPGSARGGGRGGGRVGVLAVRPGARARPGRVPGGAAGQPGRGAARHPGRGAEVRGAGDRPGPPPDHGPRPAQAEGAGGGDLR